MDYKTFILQSQAGDVAAYSRLVHAAQGMVYAVAYRVLRNHASAQDAAQEAFLRAYRRIGELADPSAFHGWLRRIAVTAALDQRRRERMNFVMWRRQAYRRTDGRCIILHHRLLENRMMQILLRTLE